MAAKPYKSHNIIRREIKIRPSTTLLRTEIVSASSESASVTGR